MFKRLNSITGFMLESTVIVCSVAVVSLTVFLVISRYILGWSLVGLLEIIMMFAIWLYMAGSLVASKNTKHLDVNLLSIQLEGTKYRRAHQFYISIITMIISCFFIYWAYHMMAWGMKRPQSTPGLSIPLLIPQLAIMLASIGSFLYAARDVFKAVKSCEKVCDIFKAVKSCEKQERN